jgi:hypothetical protein
LINKLRYLTDQIGTSFGKRPSSFRAGRYGFSEKVARALMANEYMLDSSVTPYVSWVAYKGMPDLNGGPDFSSKRPLPFTYTNNGNSLLEIPITIMPTKFPLNRDNKFTEYYFNHVNDNFLLRSIRSMFFRYQPLWLRPYPWMSLELLDEQVREAIRRRLPYLIMVIHSSELMAETSIYRTDRDSIEKLYELIEAFFMMLGFRGITSISLTEAAKRFELVTGTELSYRLF